MRNNLLVIAIIIIVVLLSYILFYKEPDEPIVIKNNLEQLEKNIQEIDNKIDSLGIIREKVKEKVIIIRSKEEVKKDEIKNVYDNDSLINIFRSELLTD